MIVAPLFTAKSSGPEVVLGRLSVSELFCRELFRCALFGVSCCALCELFGFGLSSIGAGASGSLLRISDGVGIADV